ncbi:MAG: SRPBCC family protein [Sulfobacillus sp.]
MWAFEHTITTPAGLTAIWNLYSDITTWTEWDQGISHASLDGPFAVGTSGLLQPQGQTALPFQLTEVDPLQGFSDVTDIPGTGIQIHFTHRLEQVEEGTKVTHSVSITSSSANELISHLGPDLTRGIPHTMERLAEMALAREQSHAD